MKRGKDKRRKNSTKRGRSKEDVGVEQGRNLGEICVEITNN